MSQLCTEVLAVDSPGKNGYDVVEVFSPPRFALEGTKRGLKCLSADLCTQWDFRRASDRKRMHEIVQQGVGLLVLCPPCTWPGGWFHLNKHYMDPKEISEKEVLTKLFVQFCCSLIEEQLKRGGRVMFEHPKGSMVWDFPCMQALMKKLWTLDLHMCCYGMQVPQGNLIRKSACWCHTKICSLSAGSARVMPIRSIVSIKWLLVAIQKLDRSVGLLANIHRPLLKLC